MELTAKEAIELASLITKGLLSALFKALVALGAIGGVSLVFAIDQVAQDRKKRKKQANKQKN